ncbi:unnamed protein product, partial [Laminaria digitata]
QPAGIKDPNTFSDTMATSKHRCICSFTFCQGGGGEATVRVPASQREEWLSGVGLYGESSTTKDPRISIMHFTSDNLVASIEGLGLCARTVVRPASGATPTQ